MTQDINFIFVLAVLSQLFRSDRASMGREIKDCNDLREEEEKSSANLQIKLNRCMDSKALWVINCRLRYEKNPAFSDRIPFFSFRSHDSINSHAQCTLGGGGE